MNSKAFKVTLGSLSALIAIILALQPYLGLVQRVSAAESEIKAIRSKTDLDHDILIRISTDVEYIKKQVDRNVGGNK